MKKMISDTLIPAALAEVGKIKIGGKGAEKKGSSGKTFRMPVKHDHFTVTTRVRGEDDNFERDEQVHDRIGETPTKLNVRLPFDEPDENFQSQMQQYKGRDLIWRCDGETAENVKSGETGQCQRGGENGCNCKPYGRLRVILEDAPMFGGVYVFRTTSWESIRNIQSALAILYSQFGALAGLPLTLELYPAEVSYQESGKTKTGTAYKVALLLRATFEQARAISEDARAHRLTNPTELKILAAASEDELDAIDEAEEADFAEEYHPDPSDLAAAATHDTIEQIKAEEGLAEPEAHIVAAPESEADEPERDSGTGGTTSGPLARRGQVVALQAVYGDTFENLPEDIRGKIEDVLNAQVPTEEDVTGWMDWLVNYQEDLDREQGALGV
jgi:hypothetical protein